MAHNLVLYVDSNYSSPYALSAYAALQAKGLPHTLQALDLHAGQNTTPQYAHASLTSRIPTLVDGNFSLSESSAIAEYLEDAYGAPQYARVLPARPQLRARARQIQAWLRSDLAALRAERPTTVIYADKNPQPLSAGARKAADKLLAAAESLIDTNGGPLFGDWCIADIDLAVMLARLSANGDAVPDKLRKYVETQFQHPAMQGWWARAKQAIA